MSALFYLLGFITGAAAEVIISLIVGVRRKAKEAAKAEKSLSGFINY